MVSNLLWGILFIVVGIIFALNALGIADINIFFDGWWTLFIIIPCFVSLVEGEDKTGNIIGLIIGICLLLGCRGIIQFEIIWKMLIPTVLIIIGLSFILKDFIYGGVKKEISNLMIKSIMQRLVGKIFNLQVMNLMDVI